MSKAEIPKTVPLPQVAEYTDDVIFGSLGLPSGFDDERIIVNLRGINRIRSLAGLGRLSVVGERGDTTSYDYDVTSIDQSGAATFGAKSKKHKAGTSNGSVTFPYTSTLLGEPDTVVKVNTAEIDHRIREKHGISGLYEAKPRANQLDKAIRSGLASASIDANLDMEKLKLAARVYGTFMVLTTVFGGDPLRGLLVSGALGPVMLNLQVARQSVENTYGMDKEEAKANSLALWKEFRQSLLVGLAVDRALLANVASRSQRLIKARD